MREGESLEKEEGDMGGAGLCGLLVASVHRFSFQDRRRTGGINIKTRIVIKCLE
jgi:hypothetical protein